mmetsp:Transcript_20906/g.35644  ORF Transcript_20906/g.35644 Transcript_20906/m.35644 type:complete len:116 (-) Transcript_20906:111-458(-)
MVVCASLGRTNFVKSNIFRPSHNNKKQRYNTNTKMEMYPTVNKGKCKAFDYGQCNAAQGVFCIETFVLGGTEEVRHYYAAVPPHANLMETGMGAAATATLTPGPRHVWVRANWWP